MRLGRLAIAAVCVMLLAGAAVADTHTWTGADPGDNNWTTPGNWDINQVPIAGDDVVINTDAVIDIDVDTAALNDVTWSGSRRPDINGPGKLTFNGTMTVSSSGVPEWGQGSKIDAQISGTGKIVLAKGGLFLTNTANDFSGGIDLIDPGYRQFLYTKTSADGVGSLGSGDVLIKSAGTGDERNILTNDYDYAAGVPKITVQGAGSTFNNHDDLLGGGPIVLDGGAFGGASDPGDNWTCAVDIQVLSDSKLYGAGRTSWYDVYYTGDITGTSVLTYRPPKETPEAQRAWMRHANLSFEGDWIIGEGIVTADAVKCLGSGDLIVEGQNVLARLELDVAGATSEDNVLYLVNANVAELDLDADNTVFACNVGGTLAGGEVTGGTWLPAGDYDATTPDPPGVTLSDYFDFGNSTLTVVNEGLSLPVPEPGSAVILLLGAAGLARKSRRW